MTTERAKPITQATKEWTQFVLLLFASAFGVYQFVYKEIIVPARRPATLTVSGTLEEIGRKGNMVLVRARVHAVNGSDAKIYVPAFWYTATGLRMQPAAAATPVKTLVEAALDSPAEGVGRYSTEDASNVVAVWRLPSVETWYEPRDQTTNEELFYVPVDNFDAIRLKIEVIVAKSIDGLAGVQWLVADNGALVPQLLMKENGYDKDTSKVKAFSFSDAGHLAWERENRVGQNWSIATLSLIRPPSR